MSLPRCLLLCLLLSACGEYDVKINETVVYTPRPLFSDYDIPDTALGDCVRQHIEDGKITAAPQLQVLNCSHAGIETVDGLAPFGNLQRLKLSGNRIRNISALGVLDSLVELYLDDNRLLDSGILYGFERLRTLDLSGNPQLICPPRERLATVIELTLPDHCDS
jgi:Leucine-rich repeat (LRR) protein